LSGCADKGGEEGLKIKTAKQKKNNRRIIGMATPKSTSPKPLTRAFLEIPLKKNIFDSIK
jgi:hypothetical protein